MLSIEMQVEEWIPGMEGSQHSLPSFRIDLKSLVME